MCTALSISPQIIKLKVEIKNSGSGVYRILNSPKSLFVTTDRTNKFVPKRQDDPNKAPRFLGIDVMFYNNFVHLAICLN